MDKTLIDALAERVDRLERENRRLKRIGAGLLIGAALTLAAGAAGGKVVEAERIVLSKGGTARAVLEMDKEGMPSLDLLDETGKPQISLAIDQIGPSLNMWSSDGKDQVGLGIAAGAPQYHLISPGKMVAMVTNGGEAGSAELTMYDDDAGGERVSLRARDGWAALTFHSAWDKVAQSLSLGADKDGSMSLLLEDSLAED
jgi:hypothetical protein